MTKQLRVAIIGAGPAGIYAGNILAGQYPDVEIDLFDMLPAPYGLIRYGVSPDHPRIKGIVNSLHEMLNSGKIRFFGNVNFGTDLHLADIRKHYHAVIFATGAIKDAQLNIPGIDLDGSYGAADFVSWFDGHPDVPRTWPLEAEQVAVLGNGNVALDVARMLAKHADDLLVTDIPDNVYQGFKQSPVTDVHIFGRRGPASIKFTPIELRELGELNDVDIVLYDEDFPEGWFDEDAEGVTNQHKVMARVMDSWLEEKPSGASRRLHMHFWHKPVAILGEDGKVAGMKFERTQDAGAGSISDTGVFVNYPLQAVYRAIGYFGSEIPGVPFDDKYGVIKNDGGRVVDEQGKRVDGLYATGWIKRGPVGLIGHTKSDALETIGHVIGDKATWWQPSQPEEAAVVELLDGKGVQYVTWADWLKVDAEEVRLGEAEGRERIKLFEREDFERIARNG